MYDLKKDKELWRHNLAWMTEEEKDDVELEVLRYLERTAGFGHPVDNLLAVVTKIIESKRR